ncbi:MAG: NapC/NirT family cytochrome c [Anaerolineales bacterium]|uniref:NapC/NirT family cytochrome c n=1 Tax=Candidatus Desulfolinea nitratireducens TaxID=2841698 RepID=A0A8J6TGZ2_9CHLR|nr:NapC/NirT family cytochrome c [Candidatus Desulfolinea nitratireducens]
MTKIRALVKKFFFPPDGSPRWMIILPYAILGVFTVILLIGGAYGWEYTNSSPFCGESCHTMPPEYAAYQVSPHAEVACVECHIGEAFIGSQIWRKAGDIKHIIALAFTTYEYPIYANNMRPSSFSCEQCHSPSKFSDDSLRKINHFDDDESNTPSSIYLVLKTGGGSEREGLGRGIHWHIENDVFYYAADSREQSIPYVRVVGEDGSFDEYIDIESDYDSTFFKDSELKKMDCITCHNRISHRIYTPSESMDAVLMRMVVDSKIPNIHNKGVEVLSGDYATQEEGLAGIASLTDYYKENHSDYYVANKGKIETAVEEIQQVYTDSVFIEQEVDWDSHASNMGHTNTPGCFRCHDGKHLNEKAEAVRLECNLCHSIPVVVGPNDFLANINMNRGVEPESHLNTNWISLHNETFDQTCASCHTTEDVGGTSNTSFCSNSACHGSVIDFTGFDAPGLREILADQLPTPVPTPVAAPASSAGPPTYAAIIEPIFALCTACHNQAVASAGLDLSSYAGLMAGGDNGDVVLVGDGANSLLIEIQTGKHFANITSQQLELLAEWIDEGALDN